jgi:hypothetical protein
VIVASLDPLADLLLLIGCEHPLLHEPHLALVCGQVNREVKDVQPDAAVLPRKERVDNVLKVAKATVLRGDNDSVAANKSNVCGQRSSIDADDAEDADNAEDVTKDADNTRRYADNAAKAKAEADKEVSRGDAEVLDE